jgi:hypothetical protein
MSGRLPRRAIAADGEQRERKAKPARPPMPWLETINIQDIDTRYYYYIRLRCC